MEKKFKLLERGEFFEKRRQADKKLAHTFYGNQRELLLTVAYLPGIENGAVFVRYFKDVTVRILLVSGLPRNMKESAMCPVCLERGDLRRLHIMTAFKVLT